MRAVVGTYPWEARQVGSRQPPLGPALPCRTTSQATRWIRARFAHIHLAPGPIRIRAGAARIPEEHTQGPSGNY